MADLPAGATLIPSPVNQIAGFSVADHHFLPGFPNMAWPMAEWVLDQRYRHLHVPGTWIERALRVYGAPESSLIPLMHELLAEFSQIKLSSLPSPERRGEIELGLSGDPAEVTAAHAELVKGLDRLERPSRLSPEAGSARSVTFREPHGAAPLYSRCLS